MLLVTDLQLARKFYARTLGSEILIEDDAFVTFACGGEPPAGRNGEHRPHRRCGDEASCRVDDLAAKVAELRSRGVEVLDLPDVDTVDGVADVGFALAAWIADRSATPSDCFN